MTAASTEFATRAATMTPAELRRWLLGYYMLDMPSVRRYFGVSQSNRDEGRPAFDRRGEWGLRVHYASCRIQVGTDAVLRELEDATPGPAIAGFVRRELDYLENGLKYANGLGRLHQFGRYNDMPNFAHCVANAARYSGYAQRAHLEGRAGPIYESPKGHIADMAVSSLRRWLPAIQNIIYRLPEGEQLEAKERGENLLNRFLRTLSDLHTLALKVGDERKRWAASGVGALDVAVVECAQLIHFAHELAGRMEDDGTDSVTKWLRHYVAESWDMVNKALVSLADERLQVLCVRAWGRDKAGMLMLARENGGITPDGATLYYKKGSRLPAY